MKSPTKKLLAESLIAVFCLSSTLTRADAPPTSGAAPDKGRFVMPLGLSLETGERLLSFEDEFGDREEEFDGQSAKAAQLFGGGDSGKAWLLEANTFNLLSSAGQRAALWANRRLRVFGIRGQSRADELVPEANFGDNVRVNDPALDTDFHTHSETSIAINGSAIIISFNEFGFNGYGVSTDSGMTWSHKRTPDPPGGSNLGDGVVAFGPNGECYYAGLAFVPSGGGSKSIIGVAKSTNNGTTFSPPVDASTTASNSSDFQDKEWVAVDRNAASPFKGNVYVSWTDFTQSTGSFINFSRSTNGGASFEAPIAVSPQDRTQSVQGSVPVVAPNGDLYVAFSDNHPTIAGIGIVKSTDGGRTFSAEKKVAAVISTSTMTGGGGVRTNSFPSVTIDGNGAIHFVYGAWTVGPSDRADVFYVRSTDFGNTFSLPTKLNDDATPTTQVFPSIAAASDGTLGVKWWDRRNDPASDSLNDVYMAISHDGGTSFGKNFRVTDHNWLFGPIEIGFAGGYHGDYDGIAADAGSFYLSWSDERAGEADAFFSQVSKDRDPNTPDFNISAKKPFDNVIAGNSAAFNFSTSAANGFTGSFNLSASPAINGLTYTFTNASINAGETASLSVSSDLTAQPGPHLITVTATGGGLTRKTNFRVNVLSSTRFAGVPSNASRTKGFTTMQGGVKVDDGGTVHVVFDDDSARVRGSDAFYSRSTDGGLSFSAPIPVAGVSPIAVQSTLALDSAGNPFVVWTGFNPVPAQGTFATLLSKSTDHGNTFSAPVVASGTSRNAQSPKIAVDKNGNVQVVYVDLATAGSPVFAVRSTDGGATFSAPSRVSLPGETIGNPPFVALDSTGAAYVVYQDNGPPITIKLAVAQNGSDFSAPRVISDLQVSAFAPQIAIDTNDRVFATFYNRYALSASTFNRESIVIRSTDRGTTFGPQINVSNNADQGQFPSLLVGDQGLVSVVWEDTAEDPQRDVFVARSTDAGTTFGPPINLSANGARSFGAFGGADSAGNLIVGWTDDSGANTELFVSSLGQSATGPPDFTLGVNSAALNVRRSTRVELEVKVNRFGGFAGNVTLTPPSLDGKKAKKIKFTPTATGGVLSFKLKGGGVLGPQILTFTGRDDSGRTRLAILAMIIQPAG
ncbi:MAG TPA: sialidase family protein [Blastocatellia bacterium]|nr:sialidase family protein [Blastocatellia bacterium]